MAEDAPAETDFSKVRILGRGHKGLEAAARIAHRRRLAQVQLDPDVASVFRDSTSVNKALRAMMNAMPATVKHRRSA